MNGPTRSTAFDRPATHRDGQRSTDAFDELDQFVDSEPAAWLPALRQAPREEFVDGDADFASGPGATWTPERHRPERDGHDAALRSGGLPSRATTGGLSADGARTGHEASSELADDPSRDGDRDRSSDGDDRDRPRDGAAEEPSGWNASAALATHRENPVTGAGAGAGARNLPNPDADDQRGNIDADDQRAAYASHSRTAIDPGGRGPGPLAPATPRDRTLVDVPPASASVERNGSDRGGPARPATEPTERDAAFVRAEPRSERREAFAKRLDDELSRPTPRPVTTPVAPRLPERGGGAAIPRPETPGVGQDAPRSVPRREDRASVAKPGNARPVPVAPSIRPQAASPVVRRLAEDAGDPAPRPSGAAVPEAAPSLATRRPYEEARDAAQAPAGEPEGEGSAEAPADALDWELDNAIGAIIASGRGAGREDERAIPPAPEDDIGGADAYRVAPAAVSSARARDMSAPSADTAQGGRALVPVAPVPHPVLALPPLQVALGKRPKPIPSFRYARREEAPEPALVTPPDVDDPFASVFFPDARGAFADGRGGERHGADALDDDGLTEEDRDDGTDLSDELPPSLSRAARGERRGSGRRSSGVLSLLAALGVAVGLGYAGLSLMGGTQGGAEDVRVIRADAQDVKVRNEDVDASEDVAAPDISESVALGETDRLVVPDRVQVGGNVADPEADDSRGPRQVRTVVVRPDGSIVAPDVEPSDEALDVAAAPSEDAVPVSDEDDVPPSEVAASTFDVEPMPRVIDTSPDIEGPSDVDGADSGDPIASLMAGATGSEGEGEGDVPEPPEPVDVADPSDGTLETRLPPARPAPPPRTARAASPTATRDPAPSASPEQRVAALTRTDVGDTGRVPPTATGPNAFAPVAPAEPTVASSSDAPWGVQVSAQRSRDEAASAYASLQRRYPSVLAGKDAGIAPAAVDGRGTFYRVRVGASSRGEAARLCDQLKAAGADCFVGRN